MRPPSPIHCLLLAAYPILFLYAQNVDELPTTSPLALLFGSLSLSAVAIFLTRRLGWDRTRSALGISLAFVFFFLYGHAYAWVAEIQLFQRLGGGHRYLLPCWGALFGAALLGVRRIRDAATIARVANIIAGVLVAMPLATLLRHAVTTPSTERPVEKRLNGMEVEGPLRDVYFIVLDAYGGTSVLKEFFGYDNRSFIEALQRRGFFVIPDSRSNYVKTHLSLSATLNMSYHPAGVPTSTAVLHRKIRNSEAGHFLRERGYQTVHISSGATVTAHSSNADLDLLCSKWGRWGDEFLTLVVETSLLSVFGSGAIERGARGSTLCTLESLSAVSRLPGPKFVFVHFLCPHPPYVFTADGSAVPAARQQSIGPRRGLYIDQLVYISKRILPVLDGILDSSGTAPIVVLQGDHGPDSATEEPDSSLEDYLRERTSILNALYLPAVDEAPLYSSMSPVNTFRVVFNQYFSAEYEILADRIYMPMEDDGKLQRHSSKAPLVDVTESIRPSLR